MMPFFSIKTGLGGLGMLAGGFAVWLVGGVSAEDVAAKEDVSTQLAVVTVLRAPGDIIAVSPDGQSVERICGFRMEPPTEAPETVSLRYFNTLAENLPFLTASEVALRGRIELLDRERMRGFDTDCGCRLAEQVNQRKSLCQSSKLVMQIEGEAPIPFGASLHRDTVYLGPDIFAGCGMEFSPAAEAQATACPLEYEPHWTARLRQSLNVIERRIQ